MIKNKLLILLCFLGIFRASQAQVVALGDSSNISNLVLSECHKPDTLTVFIRVASGSLTGTVTLSDTFNSFFSFQGVISSSAILSYSGVNSSIAKLTLDASVLNSYPSSGIKIQYLVMAKCGAGNSYTAAHKLALIWGAGSKIVNGQDFISAIRTPSVVVDPRNAVDVSNGVIGNSYTRKWRIRNTGSNSQLDTTWLRIVYQKGILFTGLKIDGVSISPTFTVGDTIWYKAIKTLRNQSAYPADTIFIEETYQITDCSISSGSSLINAYWGCFDKPLCNMVGRFASTQVTLTVPDLKATLKSIKYGCYGSYDTITMMYYNTGQGAASNVKFRIDNCYPLVVYQNDPDIGSSVSYFDTASIRVKTGLSGTYVHQYPDSSVRFDNNRSYWPVSNPIGTFYLNRKTLTTSDTVYVEVRRYRGLYDNTYCSNGNIFLNYHIFFSNNCGTVNYNVPMTNVGSEWHAFYGKTIFNGPAYLNNGDTGVFEFTTQKGSGLSMNMTAGNYFMMKVTMPAGVVWDGNSANLTLSRVGSTFSKTVDSVYYNSSTGILEAYYKNLYGDIYAVSAKPKFYLNCSGSSGTQNIYVQYFNVKMQQQCNWQKLPFSCNDAYPITLICPSSCPRGGVSPYFSEFKRTTYGKPDNNNDGIPDISGSLDFTKIEWNKLAPRDTFKLTYKGKISRGSASPSSNFVYGYGRVWFPNYGSLMTALSANIKVKDNSASTNFTVTGLTYNRFDTGNRTSFVFDYSSTKTGYPSGYYFDNNDSFEFEALFVFNKNVAEGGVADDAVTTTNSFYVSHLSNPTNDTAKYRCLDLPGNIRIVQVYKGYNGGFVTRPIGCQQVAIYSDYFQSIGDCCSNYAGSFHFPYEYRLFTTLDTIRIRIPTGYVLDSTLIRYVYTAGAGNAGVKTFYTANPISIVGEWYTFLITPYYNFAGGSTVPSSTGSYWQMYNYVRATCAVAANSIITQYTGDRWIGRNSWSGISTRGVLTNHHRGTYEFTQSPNLDLSNSGATTVLGTAQTVSWDVKVQNTTVSASAGNTWLAFKSKNGKIIVDSVKNIATSSNLSVTNGIFKIGTVAGSTDVKLRIFARFNSCDFDSLKVFTGWNCTNYPSGITAVSGSCVADSTLVYLQPTEPVVQADFVTAPSDPVYLCDTLMYVLRVSNRYLVPAMNITLDVELPNGGIGGSAVPTYGYKYPATASSFSNIAPVSLGNGIYRFYLSDSIPSLKTSGLKPLAEYPYNELHLKLRMITNCDFISGTTVRFIVNGKSICGKAIPSGADFDQINIIGAPTPKLHLSADSIPIIAECDSNFTAIMKIKNYELFSTSSFDQIWVTLPNGVYMKPNSTKFYRNKFNDSLPRIDTVSGRQRLKWTAYPVPSYDSSVFSFTYKSPDNEPCGPKNDFFIQTISTYLATCGPDTCTTNAQNSSVSVNRPPLKPALVYNTGTGTVNLIQDTSVGGKYIADTLKFIGVEFKNNGNKASDSTSIMVFYDANNNGNWDTSEQVLHSDSLPNLNPGNSTFYNRTLIYGHKTLPSNNYIKIKVNQKCNCSGSFVATPIVNYIPLEMQILNLTAELNNDITTLNWTTYNEDKIKHFDILRTPQNQAAPTLAGKVNANGIPYNLNNYIFNDNVSKVPYGWIYYQLKSTNSTGIVSYSPIVSVLKSKEQNLLVLFPNPASNKLNIKLNLSKTIIKTSNLSIYSNEGKLVMNKSLPLLTASEISIADITQGMYIVQLVVNGVEYRQKLMVSR